MSPKVSILFYGDSRNVGLLYAGQVVAGKVYIQTNETIKMRGVLLKVRGKARVRWTEGSGENSETYTGKEDYLKLEIQLIGSRSNDSELRLQPGSYSYPFNFILPTDLPSSFERTTGHIRYHAKAVIDRPWAIDDKIKVALTVVRLLDLSKEPPQLREPMIVQVESPAGGCCCVGGFTEITISLSRGMFVPGETMLVQGQIVNRTDSQIQYSTVSFLQKIVFCATTRKGKITRTKVKSKTLAGFRRPSIQSGHTDSWNDLSFVVPQDIPVSRLDGCRIINITYSIVMIAVFVEWFSNSSAQTDVVIGNIALQNDFLPPPVVTTQPPPYHMAAGYSQ